ncbi:MAG: C69 family dipeptidase [Paludibacteraceae bacterium]|nr:C69 family dipeptidase [Paludibacteraceae bacterium]
MKREHLFTLILAVMWTGMLSAQQSNETDFTSSPAFGDNCTSILVGPKATEDGSAITSHTCDSWYRTWMQWLPSVEYKNDTLVEVYSGKMHTEYPAGKEGVEVKGKVKQKAGRTYRVLDTAYPCLNEKQLAMGETTFGGRDTMRNSKGVFMIEELARLALQRCSSAREAILYMGELAYEYGYGDGGECLTITDPKEAWIFEILGEGPDQPGAVWAACRIPDDEVCVSANISRIGSLAPLQEPAPAKQKKGKKSAYQPLESDNIMASQNVFAVARKLGLWDGKEEFSFWRAYSGKNFFGKMQNYANRELFIMQQLAPSLGLHADMDELPLSVKPEHPLSVKEVSRLLGSYYEGTEQDLTQMMRVPKKGRTLFSTEKWEDKDSIVSNFANPWMRFDEISAYYAMTGDSRWDWVRTIAVPQCAYSTVIQVRHWLPDAVGGVCWMSLDNPGQSPRFPIFAGGTELPAMLKICGQHRYRDDCLLWHYRQTNKLAAVRWGICRKTLEPARDHFLDKGLRELPLIETTYQQMAEENEKEATALLNDYTADFVGATVLRWDELYRSYWRKFWAGF